MSENADQFNEWFSEANVSRSVVKFLEQSGYEILKNNSEKISDRGADIIAKEGGKVEVIEAKGYPTEYHMRSDKKGQKKTTNPKLQAGHWFSDAIFSCIKNHTKYRYSGTVLYGIALPYNERYEQLISSVEEYFTDHNLNMRIYFVKQTGEIFISNLNKKLRTK